MQLLMRSERSKRHSRQRLPILTQQQTDKIELEAKRGHYNLSVCPTCGSGPEKPVPGVSLGFSTSSTYKDFEGKERICDCSWQDTLRRHYLVAEIPEAYWRLGEDSFYGDREAWDTAQQYLAEWEGNKTGGIGLEFYSPNQGTGKTFLLTYVSKQLIQRGESVHYHPFRDIMGLFQKPYEERKPIEDILKYSTVLALDEVGKAISGSQGDYYAGEFENLIRDRIDSGRVTLMTTNLKPEYLDEYYPRTYSLLAARQKRWAIGGEDVRRSGHAFNIIEQMVKNKLKAPIQ